MRISKVSLFLTMTSLAVALSGAGCASDPVEDVETGEGADSIAPFDDPARVLGSFSAKLTDNVTEADVGQEFGVPDENAPYPDTYWPMIDDGINMRWIPGVASPLEKFMALNDPSNLAAAQKWNHENAGKGVPGVQRWFGICNGWAGAATAEAPIRRAVLAKKDGEKVVACQQGEPDCIRFEIGDLNALMATIYADASSAFVGGRCDTSPSQISRDGHGRIDRETNGRGCKGLNPGSMMILLSHRLKRDRKPMVVNAQTEKNTDQIWNQPAYRYVVNRFEKVDEVTATSLVKRGKRRPGFLMGKDYRFNKEAKGFAYVDLTVKWVTEKGPNVTFVSGLSSTRSTRMTAVLELDRDSNDPDAKIIGGELLEDGTPDTNRLTNHPFAWVALGPGPEEATGHNPFVKTSVVKQLMDLGR